MYKILYLIIAGLHNLSFGLFGSLFVSTDKVHGSPCGKPKGFTEHNSQWPENQKEKAFEIPVTVFHQLGKTFPFLADVLITTNLMFTIHLLASVHDRMPPISKV